MVWLRDYARPVLSTLHTCCDSPALFGSAGLTARAWSSTSCATRAAQPIERGLPPHSVANQLGHTDGGALVQRLYGHPSERGLRGQIRLALGSWRADEEQAHPDVPANGGVS